MSLEKSFIDIYTEASLRIVFLSNVIIAYKLQIEYNSSRYTILSEDRRDDGQTFTTADLLHPRDLSVLFL